MGNYGFWLLALGFWLLALGFWLLALNSGVFDYIIVDYLIKI
jgi:hypothetical protein